MTSAFESELDNTADDFLNTFGLPVFVRGMPFKAIYQQDQFEGDSGFSLNITFTFKREDIAHFKKGDPLVTDKNEYILKHIPRDIEIDPLIALEVQFVRHKNSI